MPYHYLFVILFILLIVAVASLQCNICKANFATRNALFRHIRSNHTNNQVRLERQWAMIHFGYREKPKDIQWPFDEFISSTQVSVAKLRANCLAQEDDCPSAEDVSIVSFYAPSNYSMNQSIVKSTQQSLQDTGATLFGIRLVDQIIHAEKMCTQHVYHFLLPVAWLPNPEEVIEWHEKQYKTETPQSLCIVKDLLRSIESRSLPEAVSQRFGKLSFRERQPFHNYADPLLRLIPNYDPVWRSLDRARLGDLVENDDQLFVVAEFCADQFLQQQVRRLVGAVVAVVHGWLPREYLTRSMDRKALMETPLAPPGYLYRAEARFHGVEMYHSGEKLLELDDVYRGNDADPIEWMQEQLLNDIEKEATEAWLVELRDDIAPRIRAQMQSATIPKTDEAAQQVHSPVPETYVDILGLLQHLVESKQWPSTTAARSSIIGNLDGESSQGAGSFTVVSTTNYDFSQDEVPRGNSLFPELTHAVFELEKMLIQENDLAGVTDMACTRTRLPSSHCAINSNAEFTPHVDRGRGLGQSVSMIVGIGDYSGGELMVEVEAHGIRYRPLEFDGWRMRHWTRPFSGQRFSLVWFTPEGVKRKASSSDQ